MAIGILTGNHLKNERTIFDDNEIPWSDKLRSLDLKKLRLPEYVDFEIMAVWQWVVETVEGRYEREENNW